MYTSTSNHTTVEVSEVYTQPHVTPPYGTEPPNYPPVYPMNVSQQPQAYMEGTDGGLMGQYLPSHQTSMRGDIVPEVGWHKSLFEECCSFSGFCCLTWICPINTISLMHGRVESTGDQGSMRARLKMSRNVWMGALATDCLLQCCCAGWRPYLYSVTEVVFLYKTRRQVAQTYNIDESGFMTCLLAFFCKPCATLQTAHQVWRNPSATPGASCGPEGMFAEEGRSGGGGAATGHVHVHVTTNQPVYAQAAHAQATHAQAAHTQAAHPQAAHTQPHGGDTAAYYAPNAGVGSFTSTAQNAKSDTSQYY